MPNDSLNSQGGADGRQTDMTDRELLELAAKAAGIEIVFGNYDRDCYANITEEQAKSFGNYETGFEWNPLDDDGDNARLEAELSLNVIWGARAVRVGRRLIEVNKDGPMVERYQDHGGDRQKARRWAAVRASAEIGKGMKNPS